MFDELLDDVALSLVCIERCTKSLERVLTQVFALHFRCIYLLAPIGRRRTTMLAFIKQFIRAIADIFAPPPKTSVKVGYQSITSDVCHNGKGFACHADDYPAVGSS